LVAEGERDTELKDARVRKGKGGGGRARIVLLKKKIQREGNEYWAI